jgi:quinol monooxygenase YgiN
MNPTELRGWRPADWGKQMETKEVVVLARVRAKEGCEAEVWRELLALVEPTRREAGCLNYDLHSNTDDAALFMFHETWASREDLDRHLSQPHLDGFDERTEGKLAGPVEITFWEKLK